MDINADLGESFGQWVLGTDEELVHHITSANVACGFHAGDFQVLQRTVALCHEAGVAIGAHPGYPDLLHFGRRPLPFTPDEVRSMVLYQIGAVAAFCRAAGVDMQHVKAHGALYNTAAENRAVARAIALAVRSFSVELAVFGLASSSVMAEAAVDAGLRFVPEAFADRRYEATGLLRSRSLPEAMITDPVAASAQAVRLATRCEAVAYDGTVVTMRAETICCHGDTPDAATIAAEVHAALAREGVSCGPPGRDAVTRGVCDQ